MDKDTRHEYCDVDICSHETMEEGGLFKIWMKLLFILTEKQVSIEKVEIAAWNAIHLSTIKISGRYILAIQLF